MTSAGPATTRAPSSRGRVTVYFGVRYLTAPIVVLAIAASDVRADADRLTALVTTQVALALLSHAIASRGPMALRIGVWLGMIVDTALVAGIVGVTGGAAGPLTFLFTLHAIAAGILLSSRAGVRMLVLSTVAILLLDMTAGRGLAATADIPAGLQAIAALWIVGGGATLFSGYNERELRRRNAELATIRQVTLDIEETLSIEEIFADLCAGVAAGFRFDTAAVLLREGDEMRCAAAHGRDGALGLVVPLRGRVLHALTAGDPVVTGGADARSDGTLVSILGPRGYLAIPISEDALLVITRSGRKGRPGTLRSSEIETLQRLAHHARLAIANARLHASVSAMAITDPLTGLFNHGELQRRLATEVGRVQRYSSLRAEDHPLSVALLDIDYFKKFNDSYGHPAGDAVLKGVAAALRSAVREFDIVARYGGEEFCVILPETGVDEAREVAERVRAAVAAYPFAIGATGKAVRVTVSVGVATSPFDASSGPRLIEEADAALYRSKDDGRNRVTLASDAPRHVARVLPMEPTRRRQARDASRARAGSKRAPAPSSRPRRRTPRA